MDLISIVVPIFNVENFLVECIESIINQTYTNIEIILVDDGSTDISSVICDRYAQRDKRIIVIHKNNGGVSDARNVGIKAATGKYITFVDSDDYLDIYAIELLYDCANRFHSDLTIGCINRIDDLSNEVIFSNYNEDSADHTVDKKDMMRNFLNHGWGPWARLYSMDIHKDILFPVGKIYEDEAIALQIIDRSTKISICNKVVYYYRKRADSITTTSFNEKNLIWFDNCGNDLKWIKANYPELEYDAKKRLFVCVHLHLLEIARADKKYIKLAEPLLEIVRRDYSEMRRIFKENNKSTFKLFLMKHVPFPLYCKFTKLYYKLRYNI